jgi:hypothetical protein
MAFMFIRQPRRAVVWGLGFALVGAAIFAWMNRATNGQWWTQTIAANINDFYPDQSIGLFRLWFSLHGFLFVPAVLYALYEIYFSRISIYTLWLFAATANSILAGKWGAGDSYFATAIAGACVLSGLFASRCLTGQWQFYENYLSLWLIRPFRRYKMQLGALSLVIIPLLYLGYGRAVLHLPTEGAIFGTVANVLNIQPNTKYAFYDSAGRIAGGYADIGHFTTQADIDAGWRIVEQVRAADGAVLSEDAAFSLLAGRDVITNPTQLKNLAENGMFRGDALLAMIENTEFALIVFRARFYPVDVLRAVGENYEQVETIPMNGFDYLLWRPIG